MLVRSARSLAVMLAVVFAVCACGAPDVRPQPLVGDPGAPAAPPAWVIEGISAAHPDGVFLQAVGAAPIGESNDDARDRADFDARAKLVRQLSTRVRAETLSHELFQANDTQSRTVVSLDQTVTLLGEGVLEGARPIAFHLDAAGKTASCLLIMERASAAHELSRRVGEKEGDAAKLLARAKGAPLGAAVQTLAEAYDRVIDARVLRVSYAVIAGGPLARPDVVGAEVIAMLRDLVGDLRLQVESGQAQAGRVGGALAAPIVFRLADGQGRGIDGVTLRFALRGNAKAELSAATLDTVAGGAATLAVRALRASGDRSNQIECTIAALSQRGLSGPSVTAEYLLPTAANVRALVVATAKAFDDAVDPRGLQGGVVTGLAAAGFVVVESSALRGKVTDTELQELSVNELCRRLRGDVDFVFRITGAADAADARRDRLRARATAKVTLVDIERGDVDQIASEPADGLGDSHAAAGEASLDRLGAVLGTALGVRLRGRLGL